MCVCLIANVKGRWFESSLRCFFFFFLVVSENNISSPKVKAMEIIVSKLGFKYCSATLC